MAYEMMVGLTVTNEKMYQEYREAMAPLLKQHGGGFRFDFVVSKVLRSESNHEINRVFAIYFLSQESKNVFFRTLTTWLSNQSILNSQSPVRPSSLNTSDRSFNLSAQLMSG